MQALMKQAADVIEHNASSLGEAHTRNGIIEDREVQAALESATDLVAHLRAAALPWDQRQKKPEPTMKMLHTYGDTPQRECLCKDKCLHTGNIGQCKGLPVLAEQPAQQEPVRCPQAIINAITAYGDARADQDANNAPTTSHERLADCIRLVRKALAAQPAQQEPVGRVCFEGDEVVWTGDPPESGTLLYTSPQPAQQDGALTNEGTKAPAKCWKCGDTVPAFTDVCQVPACGMREGE